MRAAGSGSRRSRWRSTLLSGVVFPGLGQLATGFPLRGLAFAGTTVVALGLLVQRVARETLARMPEDPTTIDPLFPFRLAHEIQQDNASFFLWVTLALLAAWGGSILDAWLSTRRPPGAGTSRPSAGGRGPRRWCAPRR